MPGYHITVIGTNRGNAHIHTLTHTKENNSQSDQLKAKKATRKTISWPLFTLDLLTI
jgi:hypothetical protein